MIEGNNLGDTNKLKDFMKKTVSFLRTGKRGRKHEAFIG